MTLDEPAATAAGVGRTPGGAGHWLGLAAVLLVAGAVFAVLHNGLWTPGNDSEVYIGGARSILRGDGYTFNGQPTSIAPPGWPLVLAGLMGVSPTFAFLKAATAAMMLASLAVFYLICRRAAPPWLAALACITAALLHPLYHLTFMLHSEGLFNLLIATSVWLGLKVGERADQGRGGWPLWALVGLSSACLMYAVATRYAGVFVWPLVAGAMAGTAWRARGWRAFSIGKFVRDPRPWAMLLTGVLAAATLLGTIQALSLSKEQARRTAEAGGASDEPTLVDPAEAAEEAADAEAGAEEEEPGGGASVGLRSLDGQGDWLRGHAGRGLAAEYAVRAGRSGKWFSWLLWQPTQFGNAIGAIEALGLVVGFTTFVLLIVGALLRAARGELVWLGLVAYCVTIAAVWPNVNNRYLVPLAPLIVLAPLLVFRAMWRGPVGWVRVAGGLLAGLFVGTIVLTNGALLAADVWVLRADDYYARYEAGDNAPIVDIAAYVGQRVDAGAGAGAGTGADAGRRPGRLVEASPVVVGPGVPFVAVRGRGPFDGPAVAVSGYYKNFGRVKHSKLGMRVVAVLGDVPVLPVPRHFKGLNPKTYKAWRWCRDNGIEYYIHQRPVNPWRLWHFRLTPELQEQLTGERPPETINHGWELWRFPEPGENDGRRRLVKVTVPETDDWPRRVPGL